MKIRDILFVLLALSLAVAVILLTRHILRESDTEIKMGAVQVLVAPRDLPVGLKLKAEDLTWKTWPGEGVNPAYLTKADQKKVGTDIVGSIVRYAIARGQPVVEDKLIQTASPDLPTSMAGKRIFTFSLGPDTQITDTLSPGNFVDVIITDYPKRKERALGKTVVSRVAVMALGGNPNHVNQDAGPLREISLEVTEAQAKRLAEALKEGTPQIRIYRLINHTQSR